MADIELSVQQRLRGVFCPVHPDHAIALVGEAPGPRTRGDCPFYPYPPNSAAGRLLSILGWSRRRYLLTFARMNLLNECPGRHFPVERARSCIPYVVADLHPRPLLLMGKGVANAFGVGHLPILELHQVTLPKHNDLPVPVKLALVPHTSGRNLWYNDAANREAVRVFIESLVPAEPQVNETLAGPVVLA